MVSESCSRSVQPVKERHLLIWLVSGGCIHIKQGEVPSLQGDLEEKETPILITARGNYLNGEGWGEEDRNAPSAGRAMGVVGPTTPLGGTYLFLPWRTVGLLEKCDPTFLFPDRAEEGSSFNSPIKTVDVDRNKV